MPSFFFISLKYTSIKSLGAFSSNVLVCSRMFSWKKRRLGFKLQNIHQLKLSLLCLGWRSDWQRNVCLLSFFHSTLLYSVLSPNILSYYKLGHFEWLTGKYTVLIYFIVLQQSLILEWNKLLKYSVNLPASAEEFESENLSMCQFR